ncbi:MAG: M48 family metalloprotease [Proteobacteria bacterium]|nr:M48 family metalloprotease [Pseudomonadota bacterium]
MDRQHKLKVIFIPKLIFGVSLLLLSLTGLILDAKDNEESSQEDKPVASPTPAAEASSESTESALEDAKAEMEIGRNMAGKLLAFYGVVNDKPLVSYLNQVGNYVAKAGSYPDRKYMFAILDSDSVNAFACPGGYILVTKGTIRHAQNEAEIAAVLGHEAAHVGLQHMYKSLKSMSADEAKKLQTEAEGRKLNDPYAMARRRPTPDESAAGGALAKFLMSASGAGLSVLQAAKAGMNVMLEKGLDQKLEFEADGEGVKYAINAGYDPKGLDKFLARLALEKKKSSDKTVMDKTHPTIPDRRKAIAEVLNKMSADEITGAVLQKRFQGFQKRIAKKSVKKAGK